MKFFELFNNHQILTKKGRYKGSDHAYNQTIICQQFCQSKQNVFVVLPNLYDAQQYYDALSNILGNDRVLFYPVDNFLTMTMAMGSPEFKNERMYTLKALLDKQTNYVIVTTYQGMILYQMTPLDYQNANKKLVVGQSYSVEDIIKTITDNGFMRRYTVDRPGEFSVRGSLLDIYTHDAPNPYRLDFFGAELDSIRTFDVATQRSIEKVNELEMGPLMELFYTSLMKESALKRIDEYFANYDLTHKEQQKLSTDIQRIEARQKLETLQIYLPFFNPTPTTILDFSNKHDIFVIEPHKIEINLGTSNMDMETYAYTMGGNAFCELPFFLPWNGFKNKPHCEIEIFSLDNKLIDLGVKTLNNVPTGLDNLMPYLATFTDYQIILLLKDNLKLVKEYLKKKRIPFNDLKQGDHQITVMSGTLATSFVDHQQKIVLLSERQLFNKKTTQAIRYRSVMNQSVKIKDVSELNIGDYVVHYDYGIGQYEGIETKEFNKLKIDYINILYANQQKLHVPIEQIENIMKYRGFEDTPPKLSRLSGNAWEKTKKAVKQKIKDMADRLIKLYAQRSDAKGFSFEPFDLALMELVNDFAYHETPDQLSAISATLKDMGKDQPMDRLIAGDVGFGKTEVAIRAAYLAVLNGKQVAYLCPTTVLARQHYLTFKDRLEKYGVSVELLSRFVTTTKIKDTLARLKKGLVDIVIGTHRILSKDVNFNNLGLFIVDEEQRFGVADKERIKEMKVNVDALTLSATPIPRTLQMAIYGLKDLTVINTPPLNRYPVQTYVTERHDALITEAINREIARGGQVFYLYNRVEDIDRIAAKLQKMIPLARIGIAHGKMQKVALENVLASFIDQKYDVLVSTTIIETGVDIPNSNTLIVHDADKLGLAQLYQIRGRVGRSDKIAYAYLMYDNEYRLTSDARSRLLAIQDFTDLGSGYRIAQRDLAIRGSGDLLGSEQSGFVDSVGIDMYMRLLNEVVENKENTKLEVNEPLVDRTIDSNYIDYDPIRIEIHKKINEIKSYADLANLKHELIDRFGEFNDNLLAYMEEKLYYKIKSNIGIESVSLQPRTIIITLSPEATARFNTKVFGDYAKNYAQPVILAYVGGKIRVSLTYNRQKITWMKAILNFFQPFVQ